MRKKFNVGAIEQAVSIFGGRAELAKEIQVSYLTVSDWIRERKTPSLENCIKIEKATNGQVKVKDILAGLSWDETE